MGVSGVIYQWEAGTYEDIRIIHVSAEELYE